MSLARFFRKLCPQSLRAGPWGADPQGARRCPSSVTCRTGALRCVSKTLWRHPLQGL